jgi:hypothetical protein
VVVVVVVALARGSGGGVEKLLDADAFSAACEAPRATPTSTKITLVKVGGAAAHTLPPHRSARPEHGGLSTLQRLAATTGGGGHALLWVPTASPAAFFSFSLPPYHVRPAHWRRRDHRTQ